MCGKVIESSGPLRYAILEGRPPLTGAELTAKKRSSHPSTPTTTGAMSPITSDRQIVQPAGHITIFMTATDLTRL